MKILIFIVAYNAEKTIESVLKRIPAQMQQYDTEVLIIDDASSDGTWECAEKFRRGGEFPFKLTVLVNPVNQGYGGNQKIGFLYAINNGFDLVALVHGDGQYAPEALPMLVRPIVDGNADAVFGSRMISVFGALKGGMPLYKYVGNRILTAFQNTILQSSLSEFHTGYRIYSTKTLSRVPFQFNTNDFHFDTEIIIQMLLAKQRIAELPIPTYYGDEVCHVNGMKYAGDVAVATTVARLQSFSLMYRRNFDIDGTRSQDVKYETKLGYDSTHTRTVKMVPDGARVLDIGCRACQLVPQLKAKGCTVTGIGRRDTGHAADAFAGIYDTFIDCDFNDAVFRADFNNFDCALLLDTVEHEPSPEKFIASLAKAASGAPKTQFIITAGNVGFFITRLMLLLGQFNYGKRGILDMTHTRLFTFNSLRMLLESSGFEVLSSEGVPAPFPLAFSSESIGSSLLKLNRALIKLRKGLFSFEMLVTARPWPSMDYILEKTTDFSAARRAKLEDGAVSPRPAAEIGIPAVR
jgi:glycosyltransferase involved in cell wall biosynthesis